MSSQLLSIRTVQRGQEKRHTVNKTVDSEDANRASSVELEKSMRLFRASIKRSMARGGSSSTSRLREHRPPSFQNPQRCCELALHNGLPQPTAKRRTTQGGVIKLLHSVERKRKCAPSAEAVFRRCDKMAGKSQPRKNPPYNPTPT